MKLRITFGIAAAILAVIFAVGFSACKTEYVDTYVPEAKLLSLKIGDLVVAAAGVPVPVGEVNWIDDEYDLYGAEFNAIAFKHEADIVDARFEPKVSRGAKVKWGIANRTVRPNDFFDTRVPATFDAQDFLYFMITSEDNKITNYYRFSTYVSSPVKELSSIKVAGREGDMDSISPASTWNGGLKYGVINITEPEAAGAIIDAVPWAATASLKYAVTKIAREAPVFGDNSTLAFADDNFLYIEVTAENSEVNIYGFTVYVGRIATIKKLTFIGKNPATERVEVEALGKGTGKYGWTDNSGAGSFNSPYQPNEGFLFAVELDDPMGHWEWVYIDNTSLPSSTPSFTRPDGNNATPTIKVGHGRYLALKVVPKNRAAGNPPGSRADHFYKVKMGLLAADFKVQPKSAFYEQSGAAVALSFELDRSLTGASYQWYEINSWYGGYGFDSEGRIGGKGPIAADPNFGIDDSGTRNGVNYDVKDWYKSQLDEKDNVSLHNGGNEHYNLPIPGRPIAGASGTFTGNGTASTYTPTTNYKPFLANFTNESHYYWVVVTDTDGLTATSSRAVIVTEWNQQWNMGAAGGDVKDPVTGEVLVNSTDKKKNHYIIDLHAYETPGVFGLQAPPRNAIPFDAGNHGSSYWIPVTFPPDFDIYKYSVFTAQALFYLADGREWIQNWTQGDIGFGRNNPDVAEGREEIVLWYNLTNDNATRGLASSGNDPQGSGLSETPDYIVVKPAGTKPLNQMPPFQDGLDGRPSATDSVGRTQPHKNNNAQGWFTPYIELSELRFEGPARAKPQP